MTTVLIISTILLPVAAAVACLIFRRGHLRNGVILATGLALAATAVMLIPRTPIDLSIVGLGGLTFERIILAADVGLLILFFFMGGATEAAWSFFCPPYNCSCWAAWNGCHPLRCLPMR